jgi:hypothetical protein
VYLVLLSYPIADEYSDPIFVEIRVLYIGEEAPDIKSEEMSERAIDST